MQILDKFAFSQTFSIRNRDYTLTKSPGDGMDKERFLSGSPKPGEQT